MDHYGHGMTSAGTAVGAKHGPVAPAYVIGVLWFVVGGLVSVGFLSILTIGVLLLLAAGGVVATIFIIPALRRSQSRASAMTLLSISGLSCGAFLLTWLNREGPGTVCHTTPQETSCVDEWNPWVLGLIGAALMFGGIVLTIYVWRGRNPRGPHGV